MRGEARAIRENALKEKKERAPVPVPQSVVVDKAPAGTPIFRFFAPMAGAISNIRVYVGAMDGESAILSTHISRDGGGSYAEHELKVGNNEIAGIALLSPGDRVTATANVQLEGVWAGYVFKMAGA